MNCTTDKDTTLTCANEKAVAATEERFLKPRYRAREDDHGYQVKVYVPGAGKSGVTLSLAEEVLTITAKREDAAPEGWQARSRELPEGDYRLRLRLNAKIDPERITAKVEDGVLDIGLPLKEADKPRVIDVA